MLANWALRLFFQVAVFFCCVGALLIYVPGSPLPDSLNPTKPLNPKETPNILTNYKLKRAISNLESCRIALDDLDVSYSNLPDVVVSQDCGIKGTIEVSEISGIKLAPVKTKCGTALRLAMWIVHDVQQISKTEQLSPIKQLNHFGSYSCRPIRSTTGSVSGMSEHATANAIDISGFNLSDESVISIKDDWQAPLKGKFLKEVRDGACRWFNVTLSPDYNSLHHDHFHFDQGIWRSCR